MASIFVILFTVPTIIYVIKKRGKRRQSNVRRSRDQIRKEDVDLVEVHVAESYSPNQPPVGKFEYENIEESKNGCSSLVIPSLFSDQLQD